MTFRHRAVILMLSGTLAWINAACSSINPLSTPAESPQPVRESVTQSSTPKPSASTKNQIKLTSAPTLNGEEAYETGLDVAYSAAVIGQSAQSADDWQLVISRWQEAINLLKSVPSSSTYYKLAQKKITEYQRNLEKAQVESKLPPAPEATPIVLKSPTVQKSSTLSSKLTPTPTPTPNKSPETNTPSPKVFKAPIKRLIGGTPVIDVTFNGQKTFEMLVDTGTSGTVITSAMAKSLGVLPIPEVEGITETASGEGVTLPIGKVNSIAVAGTGLENFLVAIGSEDLEVGILGQNFYTHYDVLIRQDVVEFRPRDKS